MSGSPSIRLIFPQIGRITNPTLQEQVVGCWEAALSRGGWQLSDLEQMPFSLLVSSTGVSLAQHTRTVTDCCLALGEVMKAAYSKNFSIDMDILAAGAILHDVGKPLEYTRNGEGGYVVSAMGRILRHPISGCALAAEFGLPEPVQHMIAAHSKEGDGGYRTPEAWIIHHADFVNFEPLRSK
jgi:putative nucleotidyltransferase with HDIG domain